MEIKRRKSLYQYINETRPTAGGVRESLQETINRLLPEFFFKEFIFSENKFFPEKGFTKEFSDFLIFIEGIMIVVELKERGANASRGDLEWLQDEIEKAKKQHKNTKAYWEDYEDISLTNHRGHTINIKDWPVTHVFRVIVYLPSDPGDIQLQYSIRHNVSSQIGFIHVFHIDDFLGGLLSLITPMEITRYLMFREELFTLWSDSISKNSIPEHCFIGQFMLLEKKGGFMHYEIDEPSEKYLRFYPDPMEIQVLNRCLPYFDAIGTTARKLDPNDTELSHYRILSSFATLHRGELMNFDRVMQDLENLCETEDFNNHHQFNSRWFFNYRTYTLYLPVAVSDFTPKAVHISFNKLCQAYLYYLGKVNAPLKKLVGIMVVRPKKNIERLTCYLERKEWKFNKQIEEDIAFMKLDEQFKKTGVSGLPGQDLTLTAELNGL